MAWGNALAKACAHALVLAAVCGSVQAAPYNVKGQVEYIRTHDPAQFPTWTPPRFWFSLKGITSVGTCAKFGTSVLLVANDKQELAFVLTAQASGQEIEAYLDDTVLTNGFCTAAYVTIGNPAPTN